MPQNMKLVPVNDDTMKAITQGQKYKIQIGSTTTISNGALQKEYCTVSNIMTAVM